VADPELTGVLLVGGASSRFGSPKALARLGGETLADRGWRLLGEACDHRLALGKTADALPLAFPLLDDGVATRAPLAGVVAGLRAAPTEVAVFLPVDCPWIEPATLRALGSACAAAGIDAAVPPTGPLPGAYARRTLPQLEARLAAADDLSLRGALAVLRVRTVAVDANELANVNRPEQLSGGEAATRRAPRRA
jgi:molybdopterin-guanine dinucleotide biosynthesis protein A